MLLLPVVHFQPWLHLFLFLLFGGKVGAALLPMWLGCFCWAPLGACLVPAAPGGEGEVMLGSTGYGESLSMVETLWEAGRSGSWDVEPLWSLGCAKGVRAH